jgi:hypothetical protein
MKINFKGTMYFDIKTMKKMEVIGLTPTTTTNTCIKIKCMEQISVKLILNCNRKVLEDPDTVQKI